MISKLNKFQKSWLWKIIPVAIMVPFLINSITGQNHGRANKNYLVEIGKNDGITQAEFQKAYQSEYNRLLKQLGVDEFEKYMTPEHEQQLRQVIINQLIDEHVTRLYVNDLGIYVSEDAIKAEIKKNPAFLDSKGNFSIDRFQNVLAANGLSPAYFQQLVKSDIEFRTVGEFLSNSIITIPREIEISAQLALPSAEIQVDSVDVSKYIDEINVTNDQINEYYNKHRSDYINPATTQLSYIIYNTQDLTNSKVKKPTEADAKKYFDENQDLFSTNNYNLADIVVKDRTTANQVVQDLQAGKDFAEVAKEFSIDDLTKNDGGDLGTVTLSDLPESLAKIVKLLQVGSYSNPIEVDGEWHIVKLKNKEFVSNKFEDVKNSIIDKLYAQAKKDYQDNFLNHLRDVIDSEGSIEEFAKLEGLKVVTTPEFTADNVPAPITAQISKQAFNNTLNLGKVNNPQALNDKEAIIIQQDKFKEASFKPLEEVKEDVIAKAKLDLAQKSQEQRLYAVAETLNSKNTTQAQAQQILDREKIKLSQNQILPFYTPGVDNTAYYKNLFTQSFKGNKLDYTIVPDEKNHIVYFIALHKFTVDKVPKDILEIYNKDIPAVINKDFTRNMLEDLRNRYDVKINYALIKGQSDL